MSARTRTKQPSGGGDTDAATPQPWENDTDAQGWRTVYEGSGQRRPVPISVEVELDDVQSAWVKEEARRAGTNYAAVIRDAVEKARKKRSS